MPIVAKWSSKLLQHSLQLFWKCVWPYYRHMYYTVKWYSLNICLKYFLMEPSKGLFFGTCYEGAFSSAGRTLVGYFSRIIRSMIRSSRKGTSLFYCRKNQMSKSVSIEHLQPPNLWDNWLHSAVAAIFFLGGRKKNKKMRLATLHLWRRHGMEVGGLKSSYVFVDSIAEFCGWRGREGHKICGHHK